MSYLAGLLLLFIEEEAVVFQCFCALLSRHVCFDLFRVDKELVRGCCVTATLLFVGFYNNGKVRL